MIIVGLGNPGPQYKKTRHNVGFMVLDELVARFPGTTWHNDFNVDWCRIGNTVLIKPQEFMNQSGPTLNNFLMKKKITEPNDLIVVHDDLDFPLGEVHEQFNRSAAGHNGVQSIIDVRGQEFSRLRIGIGQNRTSNIPAEDYVLQQFDPAEIPVIKSTLSRVADELVKRLNNKVPPS